MIDQVVVSVRATAVSVVELFPKEIASARLKCRLARIEEVKLFHKM
jgi:hypothetical protein